jgi:hypothetical protein
VHGGDRRLQREAPGRPTAQRLAHQGQPLADGVRVPLRAVLLLEQDQPAVGVDAGRTAGVGEQHERQQAGDVGVVRQEGVQHPGQVGGPLDQVAPDEVRAGGGGVPGREEQVHHREHRLDALRQLGDGRHAVGDAGGRDLLLGAGDPCRHRGLGHQEGASHLGGGQAADQAQGQGDLRLRCQRRVTAGADQPQSVVGDVVQRLDQRLRSRLDVVLDEQRQRALPERVTTQQVERPAPGRSGMPVVAQVASAWA